MGRLLAVSAVTICFALASFGVVSAAFADEGVYGVLAVVKGDVQVQSGKDGSKTKAKLGGKIYPKDIVITGTDARAKVVMVDKNVLNVAPDSKLVLEDYKYKPDSDEKKVTLNVLYGKVRSTVNQKYDGEKNTFHVKTPAAVAGVRGTDFLVQFSSVTNAAKVVTFEGRVEVGAKFDQFGKIANPVAVTPGQFTMASNGAPPAPPATVPKAELAQLNNDSKAPESTKGQQVSGNEPGSDNKGSEKNGKGPNGDKGDRKREPSGGGGDKGGEKGGGSGSGTGANNGDTSASGGTAGATGDSASAGGPVGDREPASTGGSTVATEPAAGGGMGIDAGDLTNTPTDTGITTPAPGTGTTTTGGGNPIDLDPCGGGCVQAPTTPIAEIPKIDDSIIRNTNTHLKVNIIRQQ